MGVCKVLFINCFVRLVSITFFCFCHQATTIIVKLIKHPAEDGLVFMHPISELVCFVVLAQITAPYFDAALMGFFQTKQEAFLSVKRLVEINFIQIGIINFVVRFSFL